MRGVRRVFVASRQQALNMLANYCVLLAATRLSAQRGSLSPQLLIAKLVESDLDPRGRYVGYRSRTMRGELPSVVKRLAIGGDEAALCAAHRESC